jgi:hypothetical protein
LIQASGPVEAAIKTGKAGAKVYRDASPKYDPYDCRQQTVLAYTHRSHPVDCPILQHDLVLLLSFWAACLDPGLYIS